MNTVPRDAAPASIADLDRDYLVHPLSELRRGLVENSRTVGAYLLERLREAFAGHPDVEDVRGVGLMAGVGWRRGNLSTMKFYEKTERVSRRAFDGGLIVRSNGDTTMLAPPLCTTREDVDEIVATLRTAVAQATS